MSGFLVATSRRYGGGLHYSGPAQGPLRHALHPSRPRASRTGSTYAAACGAQVARVLEVAFDGQHPRACPECRRMLA